MWRYKRKRRVVWINFLIKKENKELKVARIMSIKKYRCSRCGYETSKKTNHFGPTWSWGNNNTCPLCPPWAKYPEFGGQTIWICVKKPSENLKRRISCN